MRRLVVCICLALLLLPVCATSLTAQQGPPYIHITAPTDASTRYALNPAIRIEYDIGGECLDDGNGGCNPDPATLVVKANGAVRTSYFTVTEWNAHNGTGNTGNFNLNGNAWNTIYATICNDYDCAEETISVYVNADPQAVVVIGAQNPGVYNPGACTAVPIAPGAAFACDALVMTHAIPGYVSLGTLRSAGVVYSTRSALSQLTVPASVSMAWDAGATTVEARLGGQSSTYWNGPDWDGTSGTVTRRIMLSKPENTAAGGYIGRTLDSVLAIVHNAAGAHTVWKRDTLPFYFERDSLTTPIARGWGIAGLSRIYDTTGHNPNSSAPSGSVLLVQGGGGIAYYKYLSTSNGIASYGRPAGMLAMLTKSVSTSTWTLLSIDGTRQYYSWVTALGYARLDSITTPGGKTSIAYRGSGSGSPATITDPIGQQVRFDYYSNRGVGSLQRICAPAGANEHCTSFTYGTSGSDTVVVAIVDPDNGVDSLGYAGGPHWSAATSIRPRGLGRYSITYHSAVVRPAAVVQPGSSDTVKYLAPQLAGAALVGGTSGNPASTVHPDSAWGSVRQPLGQTGYFTADWLGNPTLSKGPDGKISRVNRNTNGQPTSIWRDSNYLVHWTYNAVGAVVTVRVEGGDTNRVTYKDACESGTGYPCLPTQVVIKNTPLPPDTTVLGYGGDEVVDSVYRSNGPLLGNSGLTLFWHGANARVDSVVDPRGHRDRLFYEATWGNPNRTIRDSIVTECQQSCSTVRDSVTMDYDATGRMKWTQRGAAGRKVSIFRDLIARDTMVIDSAQGGGSAITTKTRYDDAARTTTLVDGNSRSVTFFGDARGRLIKQTDAASARDTFAYDANDRLVSWTTRVNSTITLTYDTLSRVRTKYVPGDGTWTYGYHASYGTLDTLLTPSASIYRIHNAKGWMTEEKTVVNGVTRVVKYAYNQSGTLDTLTDPWSQTYEFGWDATNRARTITNPFSENFSIRHSVEGLTVKVVFPTGADSLVYDGAHLLRKAGLGAEVTYTRDSVTKGLRTIKLGGMTQTFSFDGFGRLASEAVDSATYGPTSESYSYDAAGNRTGTGYSYAVTNALRGRPAITGDTLAPGDSLVFDATGNPVWWKNKTTAGYDSLTWDAEGRLIRLRRYSSGGSLQLDVNYAYDGFGRRVRKWGTGTGVTTRLYVWNGWELLAETDSSGNAVQRYTHHPEGLDFPLAMRQGGNLTSFFHLDGQGNVYLLTNSSGTRRSEYRYRAWGDRRITPVGEAVQSPFGYKGREEDRETGLVYMRYRYYSPRLERFLNEDPIGVAGGLNVFAFGAGDPINSADPMGLAPDCPMGVVCLPPIVVTASQGQESALERMWIEGLLDWLRSQEYGYGYGLEVSIALPWTGRTGGTGTKWGPSGDGSKNEGEKQNTSGKSCGAAIANAGVSLVTDAGFFVGAYAGMQLMSAARTAASYGTAFLWGTSQGQAAATVAAGRLATGAAAASAYGDAVHLLGATYGAQTEGSWWRGLLHGLPLVGLGLAIYDAIQACP